MERDSVNDQACECACHVSSGTHRTCNIDAGHGTGCGPHEEEVPLDQACVMPHPVRVKRYSGMLCGRHYHWLNNTIDEMVELFALLPDVLLPGACAGGERVSGSGSFPPAPGSLDVLAITERRDNTRGARDPGDQLWWEELDDVPRVIPELETWARMMFEERDMIGDKEPKLDGTFVTVTRVLRGFRVWIAQQLWVDEYADMLASLHRAIARAVGDSMWPKPIGKCPNCQTPLYITIGVDEVSCRKCKSAWSGVHYLRLRRILDQDKTRPREAS
jgi:hypothetical protein